MQLERVRITVIFALLPLVGCGSAAPGVPRAALTWRDLESDTYRAQWKYAELEERFGPSIGAWNQEGRTHYLAGHLFAAPTAAHPGRVLLVFHGRAGEIQDAYWGVSRDDAPWRDAPADPNEPESRTTQPSALAPPHNPMQRTATAPPAR